MMYRELPRTFHIDHPACRCDVCLKRPRDLDEPRDVTPTPIALCRATTPHVGWRMLSYACYGLLGGFSTPTDGRAPR